ncbi:acetyl-CoA carboxylase carboxyltransferase subunit alpha [Actinoallomurus sp. CA-142502]|uniref:acetyl-CoA carboxylase carboxyltransferase subunit alpha n=1 Tax=Actinoallomurus sp. CA-142502 TaxID=3239885 RepID=UPI003D90FD6C
MFERPAVTTTRRARGAAADATPPAAWVSCPACRALLYGKRFERDLKVCSMCGHHARLTAPERIAQLLDPGSAVAIEVSPVADDPLGFVDLRPYRERLDAARAATGLREAVLAVRGRLDGTPVVLAVMDFRFLGGSLGSAVGEQITNAAETSLADGVPLVLVTASGGARMQEGALSLMQMVKTSQALARLNEAGILTISLVTDPTYGGVAASFATLADVIIAEPGARLGFAGPRVIKQTIGVELPDGFQTAEFLLAHGLVDEVQRRGALRGTLARLLAAASGRRREAAPPEDDGGSAARTPEALIRRPDRLAERSAWEIVQLARHPDRPTTLDYVTHAFDGFQELHGDRASGDCRAIVAGVGRLDDDPVVLIGHQKGRDTRERIDRNFGMPSPEGYRKTARLMRLAAKLGLPVVTFIDTPGADPGLGAEERGQAGAIAENLALMSGLPTPIVAVVTGEGGSGGALALAVADRVLMLSNAVYSVISPEGCAAILWKDGGAAERAATALKIDARELLSIGVVDAVVPEPAGGAHRDPVGTAELVRAAVASTLRELSGRDPARLVRDRRARFRAFGNHRIG